MCFPGWKKELCKKGWEIQNRDGETMDVDEAGEATGSGGHRFGGCLSALLKLGGSNTCRQ